jgi:Ca-activated chloride channel family protein
MTAGPDDVHARVIRSSLIVFFFALAAQAQPVRITQKPTSLVHGTLTVAATNAENVVRNEVFVNGVKYAEARGRSVAVPVLVTDYIRRLRIRVVGYDAENNIVGEDEMVVNDPKPPFRVRLLSSGNQLSASIVKPENVQLAGVDFYYGEEKIATATSEPWTATFNPEKSSVYARVVARTRDGEEANDVLFFGSAPSGRVDVTLQQIPLSVVGSDRAPHVDELTLLDNADVRKIEALVPASDQPLYVVLLVDYSESMIEEMPVVKAAAKQFAQRLLRPNDRIAVAGFNQTLFWLTPFTNDFNAVAAAIDRVKPAGQTHLYDSTIEMLFELQKQPGRQALVVFTDGVDQGSTFKLDHLVHYARYAGVPLYPIIKNKILSRLMKFGIGRLQAAKLTALARDTGATYFIIEKEAQLPAVYDRLAQELRQQYILQFYADLSAGETWHPLTIKSTAGQSLRIPKGYFP